MYICMFYHYLVIIKLKLGAEETPPPLLPIDESHIA